MHHPFYKGVVLGSVVAVVVLMAATALAGTGIGAVFNLGKVNTVNRTSNLSGATKGKMLQVTNKGSGAALGLKVKAGRPPLAVNSTARVKRLNADLVDGLHAGELRKVYTARRDLTLGSPYEELLTLPGLGRISALNNSGSISTLNVLFEPPSQETVNLAMPGHSPYIVPPGSVWVTADNLDAANFYQVEWRWRVWNSKKSAIVELVAFRVPVPGSGVFTVFIEATVQ